LSKPPILQKFDDIDQKIMNNENNINILMKKSGINYTEVFSYQNDSKQPFYSTCCVAFFKSLNKDCIICQGWDYYLYVLDFQGNIILKIDTGGNMYGSAITFQNEDGYTQIVCCNHAGRVICYSESGELIWEFGSIYNRGDSVGTITASNSWSITDISKSWRVGEFCRGVRGLNASIHITNKNNGTIQIYEISGVDESNHGKLWTYNEITGVNVGDSFVVVPRYISDSYYQHSGVIGVDSSTGISYLYIAGFDMEVCRVRASDGVLMNTFSGCRESIEPPPILITSGTTKMCIVSSIDKSVYALKQSDLTKIWSTELPEPIDSFTTYDASTDSIYVNCRDNRCYRLRGVDGVIMAVSTDTQGDCDSRPTLITRNGYLNKSVVFGQDSGYVFLLDALTLDTQVRYLQGCGMNGSCASFSDNNGNLVIASPDMSGTIMLLDSNLLETGVIHSKGSVESSPIVGHFNSADPNGVYIIFSTLDGWIRCLRFD
jgi:outer membrane protein assembly factor BamB